MKTLSAAVISALLFSNSYAAGLGRLTVLSSLGQPLRAEVELTSVSKDEASALVAKLASAETFRQANVDFNAALISLNFAIEQRGERSIIRITSPQPLNEPFVDMLLELHGPNGRLVREYTFLLDPADLKATQSAQATAPTSPPVKTSQAVTQYAPRSQAPASQQTTPRRASAAPAAEVKGEAGEYKVKSGDTLGKIASRAKSSGVSLDQMLVAIYRANPGAFIDNNMNRLRAGRILSLPSAEEARSVGTTEARDVVRTQSADFNNYRNRLAGQVAAASAQKSVESKQSSTGKITTKVEEPATPDSESKDKLKLSKSGADRVANGSAATEDKIAREKALAEAEARVKALEKNVGDLQKLLEVKNKNLAEQQQQADAAKAEVKPATPPVAAAPAEPVAEKPAAEKPADANANPTPAPVAAAPAASETPPAPQAKPKPKLVAAPPAPEPSFVDSLLDNPLVLPGAGLLLAALGALGFYQVRRKKQQKQFEDSIITDSSLKANSLFGSTGGQSVDTNNSVFNSSFSPSANHMDINEVDPVAEADVYIAYGRDAQAEEILKEALRIQPDRNAVRVKLLEIYSNRKDLRAFEVLATELYGLTKGEGEDWAQAASLGIAIDPNNPLYASGKSVKMPNTISGISTAATQMMDEEGLVTLLTTNSGNSTLESISDFGTDSAYFGDTAAATENPLEPADEAAQLSVPEPEPEKPASNELEFNLDGMDLEAPNTLPRPAASEPSADLASIDFDFLDQPKAETETAAVAEQLAPTAELPVIEEAAALAEDAPLEFTPAEPAPMSFELPTLPEEPAAEPVKADAAQSAEPLDFDLSGISLDLKPEVAESKPEPALDAHEFAALDDHVAATDAEMATKLDLAIAYQEIGDKEGARELLDEVMKGGTPEQSEKAKSLLMELA